MPHPTMMNSAKSVANSLMYRINEHLAVVAIKFQFKPLPVIESQVERFYEWVIVRCSFFLAEARRIA